MTDNEIIKTLECLCGGGDSCTECAYHKKYRFGECKKQVAKDAIDLINRQQKEIERLDKVLNGRDQLVNALNKCYKQAKSEAIKEFWGKLKKHSRKMQSSDFSGEFWDRAVLVEDGDNLLKEMVTETE